MNKKLPSVFVNMQDKPINNNMNLFYSKNSYNFDIKREEEGDSFINKLKINKKINELFTSTRFVYKLPVLIETDESKFETTIVSRKGNKLLTLDNKEIDIDRIKNIEEK